MDKNHIVGFALMAAVLVGWMWWSQPTEEQVAEMRRQDSIAQVKRDAHEAFKTKAAKTPVTAMPSDTTALFYQALTGKNQQVVIKNGKLEVTIDTKGAKIRKARILNYQDKDGNKDVTYFNGDDQNLHFLLSGKTTNIITSDLYFTPSEMSDTAVTLTAQASNGGDLTIRYSINSHYLMHISMAAKGLSGIFAPNYKSVDVEWRAKCKQQEKGFNFENRYATLTYKEKDGGTDYLSETSEEVDEEIESALDWVAFKDQFFSAVLISKGDIAAKSKMTSRPLKKGGGYLKDFEAKFSTNFDPTGATPTEFELYIGPNDFQQLKDVEAQSQFGKELEIQKLVYLGWPIVRLINRWFTIYVFDWLTSFGINMGIVLIIITLLLKLITYPLVKKSYMSSAKMRVLKPKLEEATKKYNKPEDQMMKQQAMMQLYAQYGVSPLSGCLPMLIQLPIWIAMFNFVPNAIQLRGQGFLWIDDLSTYDPIVEWQTNICGIGAHLSLTCILFCVANILYSIMSMRQQRDQMVGQQAEQMKMMQWMMYLMPLMFFFMFNDYSAGLNFYYFISLFFSAAIMWLLRKTTNDAKLLAILEAKYEENKNNPKKTSGLAARLEAMQKQAEELRRQRESQLKK